MKTEKKVMKKKSDHKVYKNNNDNSKIRAKNSINNINIAKNNIKISVSPLYIALTFGVTFGLTACQSTTPLVSGSHLATDTTTKQSQIQLFNFPDNQSTSENTKARFLKALKQHLATEHTSVSTGKNRIRPFISNDSIDADSQSVLQTVLETFAYEAGEKHKATIKYKEEMMQELIEEVREENNEKLRLATKADSENFSPMTEEDIIDEAELRYELDYESEYEESDASTDSKKLIGGYLKMKSEQVALHVGQGSHTLETETKKTALQKLEKGDNNVNVTDTINKIKKFDTLGDSEKMSFMLKFFYRSPEQVEAMQLYTMKPFSYQSIGHYLPTDRQYKGVISYDYNSPTTQLSAQLPYAVDFTNESVAFDPALFMPMMAFIKPELLSTPEVIQNLNKPQTVSFSLPEEIAELVPSDVLFDALIKGIETGFSDMDEEQFTPVALSEDQYGKQLKAKLAVKIHWGAKQSGAFWGRVIKSMSRDLHAHIDNNKELYAKDTDSRKIEKLKHMLALWSSVEKDFQSKDIGGLMQLLEVIAPISFNETMYYYLSSNNQLIGYQTKMSMGSEIYGWTMDTVKQTRYDQKGVTTSPLYALYDESFGNNAPASIDGMAWLKKIDEEKEDNLQQQARYARYDYPDWEEIEAEEEIETADVQTETLEETINKEVEEEQLSEFEKLKQDFESFEK